VEADDAPRPSWYPDEVALAGREHLDRSFVHGYDRKASQAAADDASKLPELSLPEGGTVLDIGAGTGSFALAAADLGYRVIAVDVSDAMLQAAASKAAGRDIEFVRAGFLTYTHQGEPADLVYSRNALHHLPDFWKAMAIQRVASIVLPGGLFWLRDIVYSFQPADAHEKIEAWLASAPDVPEEGWTRDELAAHLRTEYSTFTWVLESMLQRSGFSIREKQFSDSQIFADYLCESAVG
jgi:SAM-dependent methyltransferase